MFCGFSGYRGTLRPTFCLNHLHMSCVYIFTISWKHYLFDEVKKIKIHIFKYKHCMSKTLYPYLLYIVHHTRQEIMISNNLFIIHFEMRDYAYANVFCNHLCSFVNNCVLLINCIKGISIDDWSIKVHSKSKNRTIFKIAK